MDLCGGVVFGEEFADVADVKPDPLLLIGLRLGHDVKDPVQIQFPGLTCGLEGHCLGKGGSAVLTFHGLQQILLLPFGEVGQFHRRGQGDPAVIHHLQDLRNQFGQADIAMDLSLTISGCVTDLCDTELLANLARSSLTV